MLELLLWLIVLALIASDIIFRHKNTLFIFLMAILGWGFAIHVVFSLIKASIESKTVPGLLYFLPLSLQVLSLVILCYIYYFYISIDKFKMHLSNYKGISLFMGVIMSVIGLSYISGPIFFGYGWPQIFTGIYALTLGIAFYISGKINNVFLFQCSSIFLIIILFCKYCLKVYFENGFLNFNLILIEIVSTTTLLTITLIYFIGNFLRFKLIKSYNAAILSKITISLILLPLIYFHPELNIKELHIFKKIFEYISLSANISLCFGIILFAKKKNLV